MSFPFPEHGKLVDGVSSRLLDTLKVYKTALKYCLEHSIKSVIVAGDIHHKRGSVSTVANNLLIHELAKYRKAEIRVIVVDGNHDHADRGGLVHTVSGLAKAGLVEGIEAGKGWGFWEIEGIPIHGFSYCDDRDLFQMRVTDAFETTRESGLAIFHAGFKGARVGTHLEYEVREPISAKKRLSGLGWKMVLSGHYHGHQPIRGLKNAYYIGSPMEFTRSTRHEIDKGFMVVDLERWSFKIVPLGLPKFIQTSQEDLELGEEWDRLVKGNFVDVDVESGNEVALEKYLREAGAKAWKLSRRSKVRKSEASLVVDPKTPPQEALEALLEVKADEIRAMGLLKKDVLEMGKSLLVRAAEEES